MQRKIPTCRIATVLLTALHMGSLPAIADSSNLTATSLRGSVEPYDSDWQFYFDNDSFLGGKQDRNDSGGIGSHFIEFGLTLFAPNDIVAKRPLPDDHPYANLLFSRSRQRGRV